VLGFSNKNEKEQFMRAGFSIKVGVFGLLALGLVACEPGDFSGNLGFKGRYTVARNALEAGNYSRAISNYEQLMAHSGPLEPRVRLEYAHALLRSNRYDQAASVARALAVSETGGARIAALAVQGTADHEIALARLNNGVTDGQTKSLLRAASSALGEVLSTSDDMDPLGALARRQSEITRVLASLG